LALIEVPGAARLEVRASPGRPPKLTTIRVEFLRIKDKGFLS
jgi:hypothetical protein